MSDDSLPYVPGSATSKAAADSLMSSAASMRMKVYRYIESQGEGGATDNEIENALDMRHQTASARRRDLVLAGSIKDSGMTRRTDSNRKASVWVIVPEEERMNRSEDEAVAIRRRLKNRIDKMDLDECHHAEQLLREFFVKQDGALSLFGD